MLVDYLQTDCWGKTAPEAAKAVFDMMLERHLSMATAESCTGGNIAHNITLLPGSSDFFLGGVVSYANSVKINILGVDAEAIEKYGAVSQPVVEQMAEGVLRLTHADVTVATSGVAGPGGGTPDKPVGTVWMAASNGEKTISHCFHFGTDRVENIEKATSMAFFMIKALVDN
ncbi:MAG: CinA family protein [Paludibacteraceae bacterium]|nr:CinA family protein [Paludibacteraceae bacterium]